MREVGMVVVLKPALENLKDPDRARCYIKVIGSYLLSSYVGTPTSHMFMYYFGTHPTVDFCRLMSVPENIDREYGVCRPKQLNPN